VFIFASFVWQEHYHRRQPERVLPRTRAAETLKARPDMENEYLANLYFLSFLNYY
jgi:hypothetical protein